MVYSTSSNYKNTFHYCSIDAHVCHICHSCHQCVAHTCHSCYQCVAHSCHSCHGCVAHSCHTCHGCIAHSCHSCHSCVAFGCKPLSHTCSHSCHTCHGCVAHSCHSCHKCVAHSCHSCHLCSRHACIKYGCFSCTHGCHTCHGCVAHSCHSCHKCVAHTCHSCHLCSHACHSCHGCIPHSCFSCHKCVAHSCHSCHKCVAHSCHSCHGCVPHTCHSCHGCIAHTCHSCHSCGANIVDKPCNTSTQLTVQLSTITLSELELVNLTVQQSAKLLNALEQLAYLVTLAPITIKSAELLITGVTLQPLILQLQEQFNYISTNVLKDIITSPILGQLVSLTLPILSLQEQFKPILYASGLLRILEQYQFTITIAPITIKSAELLITGVILQPLILQLQEQFNYVSINVLKDIITSPILGQLINLTLPILTLQEQFKPILYASGLLQILEQTKSIITLAPITDIIVNPILETLQISLSLLTLTLQEQFQPILYAYGLLQILEQLRTTAINLLTDLLNSPTYFVIIVIARLLYPQEIISIISYLNFTLNIIEIFGTIANYFLLDQITAPVYSMFVKLPVPIIDTVNLLYTITSTSSLIQPYHTSGIGPLFGTDYLLYIPPTVIPYLYDSSITLTAVLIQTLSPISVIDAGNIILNALKDFPQYLNEITKALSIPITFTVPTLNQTINVVYSLPFTLNNMITTQLSVAENLVATLISVFISILLTLLS